VHTIFNRALNFTKALVKSFKIRKENTVLKKLLSITLIGLLFQVAYIPQAHAITKAEKQTQFSEKVKANIVKLGTGKDARIWVKLKDRTKLEGYVSEAGTDTFVITNVKNGTSTIVPYPQVKQVKGNNLSSGTKIAIGVGVALVLIILLGVLSGSS
jgi:hypothetical protein